MPSKIHKMNPKVSKKLEYQSKLQLESELIDSVHHAINQQFNQRQIDDQPNASVTNSSFMGLEQDF